MSARDLGKNGHGRVMARLTRVKKGRSNHDRPETNHIHENLVGEVIL
jgi:hypothetical protein